MSGSEASFIGIFAWLVLASIALRREAYSSRERGERMMREIGELKEAIDSLAIGQGKLESAVERLRELEVRRSQRESAVAATDDGGSHASVEGAMVVDVAPVVEAAGTAGLGERNGLGGNARASMRVAASSTAPARPWAIDTWLAALPAGTFDGGTVDAFRRSRTVTMLSLALQELVKGLARKCGFVEPVCEEIEIEGIDGRLLAVYESSDRRMLLPLGFESRRFAGDRFQRAEGCPQGAIDGARSPCIERRVDGSWKVERVGAIATRTDHDVA